MSSSGRFSMARRGDPKVLRQVVVFLRHETGMSQEQFAGVCEMDQGQISRYESGSVVPSEKALRRMVRVAGFDWALVVHLRRFYSAFFAVAARGTSLPPVKVLDLAGLEPASLAVAPYLIEASTADTVRSSPKEEREEAVQIWTALEKHPVRFHRR